MRCWRTRSGGSRGRSRGGRAVGGRTRRNTWGARRGGAPLGRGASATLRFAPSGAVRLCRSLDLFHGHLHVDVRPQEPIGRRALDVGELSNGRVPEPGEIVEGQAVLDEVLIVVYQQE